MSNVEKVCVDNNFKKNVIAGGVSANSKLREQATAICKKHNWQLYLPELKYCGDNAAMIASQGYYEFINGTVADESLNAYATMPIDENYKTI